MTVIPIRQSAVTDLTQACALTTEVLHGHASLRSVAVELADLTERCGSPTTAQITWLLATTGAMRNVQSWAVLARGETGELVGAVVLLNRTEGLYEVVTLAGTDDGQRGAILTQSVTVARTLGHALSDALCRMGRRRDVELGPLPADSPIVEAFALGLRGSACSVAERIPVIRRTDVVDVGAYLSHGMRRTVRKATNRLNSDDQARTIEFTVDAALIINLLPQLEHCHRTRDHAHGRLSDLDDDEQRWLWKHRIHALAKTGELELATMHINDMLAAYALGIADGPVYRVLEGRFDTKWARYSPGRLLEAAVVQRMLDDPALATVDWMTAVASETLLATNAADPMVVVRIYGDRDG